ncbi:MAG: L-aspartate oxidase [Hydrogenothermus sp.]|nr:MAG: L-aspartate oxidase [Hydrogenothermus sp.]
MYRYLTEFNTNNLPFEKVDTIIVGAGLSGLTVAKYLVKLGIKPLVITKKEIGISNSFLAQGGIAVAIGKDDSPELHFLDTVKAGKGICIESNVSSMVETGLEEVINLINEGLEFDKDSQGNLKLTKEGAHSRSRILHIKDKTGYYMTKFLSNQIKNEICLIAGYFIDEILTDENRFVGVVISNKSSRKVIYAKSLVLASGGYSPIYLRNTSAYKIGGDIIGNAFRAGVYLKDMEFIQFHPTALYIENQPAYLLTEALRGEGAILIDEKGERFIDELKPRDEVAKAIYKKYLNGEKVYLDLSPIVKKGISIKERYPTIYQLLKTYGLENQINRVPVSPAAHFSMGGIEATSYGKTAIDGIFAVGEVACTGVHGANRLASNSLLECIAFGRKVAYYVYKYNSFTNIKQIKIDNKLKTHKELTKKERDDLTKQIKKMSWEYIGLVRSEEGLKIALKEFEKLENKLLNYKNSRYLYDLVLVAKATAKSALNREESRGAHFRIDFPNSKEEFRKHSIIKDKSMKIHLEVN